jgi:hypothetical protein
MSFVNMQGRGFIGTGKGLADDIVQLKQFAIDRKQVSHRFINNGVSYFVLASRSVNRDQKTFDIQQIE